VVVLRLVWLGRGTLLAISPKLQFANCALDNARAYFWRYPHTMLNKPYTTHRSLLGTSERSPINAPLTLNSNSNAAASGSGSGSTPPHWVTSPLSASISSDGSSEESRSRNPFLPNGSSPNGSPVTSRHNGAGPSAAFLRVNDPSHSREVDDVVRMRSGQAEFVSRLLTCLDGPRPQCLGIAWWCA